jgi:hypothetical protein
MADNAGAAIVPTRETYSQLQEAYDYFNRRLFQSILPNCLITLQRHHGAYGYFAAKRFRRGDGHQADEIALNPEHFGQRGTVRILSTLAHEQVHLWQHHFGTPGRGRYHNREWAAQMHIIGLAPSDTGQPGGQETGDHVSHYIAPNGAFALAARDLRTAGFAITWIEVGLPLFPSKRRPGGVTPGSERGGKRVKYTCPHCHLNAWAEAPLICGRDTMPMRPAGASPR